MQTSGGGWEYEDSDYWNQVYSSREEDIEEDVKDPEVDWEKEFEKTVSDVARGGKVLDVGCGRGELTLRIALVAREIVGIDFSEVAISAAKANLAESQRTNASFRIARAQNLPFESESFDLLFSRRGPLTSSLATLREAYRVLRKNGFLVELTIGESDKRNIMQIFGRGQMHDLNEKVALYIARMVREVGFRNVKTRDYIGEEIFGSMKDLLTRLKNAPIIPDFNPERDKNYLEKIRLKYGPTSIPADIHRVLISATK